MQVSVLLCTRNGGRLLAEAVASILTQTVRDLELVIVDDGSTDGSCQGVTDPRVRVLRTEPLGLVAALNTGLAACRSLWVARMDADDRCAPDRLERQLGFLAAYPEVDVLGTAASVISFEGRPLYKLRLPTTHDALVDRLRTRHPFVHASVVYRRDRVLELGGYRDAMDGVEDYDLWHRLAAAGARFANLPQPLYDYRLRLDSICHERFTLRAAWMQHVRDCAAARRDGVAEPPPPATAGVTRRQRWQGQAFAHRMQFWHRVGERRWWQAAGHLAAGVTLGTLAAGPLRD
jgi:glycosyltransferase involved in cell wall biosynthesis